MPRCLRGPRGRIVPMCPTPSFRAPLFPKDDRPARPARLHGLGATSPSRIDSALRRRLAAMEMARAALETRAEALVWSERSVTVARSSATASRDRRSTYRSRLTRAWVKVKLGRDGMFVVGGIRDVDAF